MKEYICKATGWTREACEAFRAKGGDCFGKWARAGVGNTDSLKANIKDGDMDLDSAKINAVSLPVCEKININQRS